MARNKRWKFLTFFTRRKSNREDVLSNALTTNRTKFPRLSKGVYLGIFGGILGAAAYLRFWAAPLSAGVDVPQFWAFAKVFHTYGLDFYRYADATLDIFPVKGWGFVYPPIWLLILGLALAVVPGSTITETFVSNGWRLAMKTPIICADLAIGCLLYWAVPGPKWKKLLFAGLWLLHPTAWYNSAVFGQFDAIAAVLLLAAVILLERGSDKTAFLIAGLAVMTKQHVLLPVAMMIAVSARRLGWRRTLIDCALLAGVAVVFSIPFLATGNFLEYGRSIVFPGQAPDYQTPLMYAFNGGGSLLTYLNQAYGWNTIGYFNLFAPVLIIAFIAALYLSYRTTITYSQAALAGFLIFIIFFYRINYQYLVIYIPLALLAASQTRYKIERTGAIIIAMLPAVWLWLFNVSFWFYYLAPQASEAVKLLDRLGMSRMDVPDYGYVTLSVVLTCLYLVYTILVFTRWRKPAGLMPPVIKP